MEEPNGLVRWAIFIFAGGLGAIVGAIAIAAIVAWNSRPGRNRSHSRLLVVAVIAIGLILIACSSPVMPVWFQIVTALLLVFVIANLRRQPPIATAPEPEANSPRRSLRIQVTQAVRLAAPLVWLLVAFVLEFPYLHWDCPTGHVQTLLVIGDSVTAGLNDGEDTWPQRLSRVSDVNVLDASQPGATVRSARLQNRLFAGQAGFVILEIGGNDMLEGLAIARFEGELDRLLSEVSQPDRTVVMFELPLPPFCSAYGAAQRRQAKRYNVTLIPKRIFAEVLTTRGATVDGIHLSMKGQEQMMESIRELFGSQLPAGNGQYRRLERASHIPAN